MTLPINAGNVPALLLPVLNSVFFGAIFLSGAFLCARGFIASGSWQVMLIGGGLFAVGVAGPAAGWLVFSSAQNMAVTVFNIGALLASIFFVLAVLLSLMGVRQQGARGAAIPAAIFIAEAAILSLFALLSSLSLMLPFWDSVSGATTVRQVVLGTAAGAMAAAAMLFIWLHRARSSPFHYWCSLALVSLSLGLGGVMLVDILGDLLNWLGRFMQYVSGLYFLAAGLSLKLEARGKQTRADELVGIFLESSRANYQLLVETSPDAIILVDGEGRVLMWNRAAERMFAYSRVEAIGSLITDLIVPAGEVKHFREVLGAARMAGGKAPAALELIARQKYGLELPVEISLGFRPGAGGRISTTALVIKDISRRRKAERSLKESEERFRIMADNSPLMIWVTGTDGGVQFANCAYCDFFGVTMEEVQGDNWQPLVHPDDAPEYVSEFRQSVQERKPFHAQGRVRRADGEWRWVESYGAPRFSPSGEYLGHVGSSPDITERIQAERLKDDFIGMVSHELKTPLTVIIGALSLLKTGKLSPEQAAGLVQDAAEHAGSLAAIIENLLELSRFQASRLGLSREPVELEGLVLSLLSRLQGKSSRHRLVAEFPAGLPPVEVDPIRLERILHNLVDNAIKYSPQGGEVLVFARQGEGELVIGVKDEGIGIAAEDSRRLFQDFERLDAYATNTVPGVGLGLKVCRILVEAHRGRIWVESTPGKGSTFFFTLPLPPVHEP